MDRENDYYGPRGFHALMEHHPAASDYFHSLPKDVQDPAPAPGRTASRPRTASTRRRGTISGPGEESGEPAAAASLDFFSGKSAGAFPRVSRL